MAKINAVIEILLLLLSTASNKAGGSLNNLEKPYVTLWNLLRFQLHFHLCCSPTSHLVALHTHSDCPVPFLCVPMESAHFVRREFRELRKVGGAKGECIYRLLLTILPVLPVFPHLSFLPQLPQLARGFPSSSSVITQIGGVIRHKMPSVIIPWTCCVEIH